MSVKLSVLLLATLCAFTFASDDVCPVSKWVNGCSTPVPTVPYKKLFTPVCNIHDVCYRCGSHFGWKQADCDLRFEHNMQDVCLKVYGNVMMYGWQDWINKVWDYSQIWKNLCTAWKKSTAGGTSEEATRVWNGIKELFTLLKQWPFIKDKYDSCMHGTKVYYKTVKTVGNYAFRVHSPDHCKFECARKLGDPTAKFVMDG